MNVYRTLKEQNQLGLAIVVCLSVILAIACLWEFSVWSETITVPPQELGRDYIGQAWGAFVADPVGLLFGETEGSAPYLKYFAIGLVWVWASYLLGRLYASKRHVVDKVFWASLGWCVVATVVVMAAWIFGAATQHFQWYACHPVTINGVLHQCYPGEEGTLDKVTHILSPAALMSIFVTVNLKDTLRLRGRLGRLLEIVPLLLVGLLIIVTWEVVESANPGVYTNVLINSETDMGAGILGLVVAVLAYNLVVPYEE